jgi:hypothetical protein
LSSTDRRSDAAAPDQSSSRAGQRSLLELISSGPVPDEMGTFFAQLAAIELIKGYQAGTLDTELRQMLDDTVHRCRRSADDLRAFVDTMVGTLMARWVDARRRGGRNAGTHYINLATCYLAASVIVEESITSPFDRLH